MLFNSIEFILLFLPFVVGIFYTLRAYKKYDLSLIFLVVSSLIFYSYWDIYNLPVIVISLVVNYVISKSIIMKKVRSHLIIGIVLNLMMLAYYKYTVFFVSHFNEAYADSLKIVLPLAISFFTFQQIGYLVDCYKDRVKSHRLVDYCLFVTFFPQLIAGPIVHHSVVIPQYHGMSKGKLIPMSMITSGMFIFCLGLAKKVLLADNLGEVVNPIFSNVGQVQILEAWVGAFFYSFQLYFDFSGYCDMAIGVGLMFGIRLPINFDSPYKANNIQDFWRRWHITLGQFLKDYVYVPLGGNQKGFARHVLALAMVMVLGGLWHGAGWTFVLWGMLHGLYLGIYAVWCRSGVQLNRYLAVGITFLSVMFAWVLFRADSVTDCVILWSTMIGLNGVVLPDNFLLIHDFSRHISYQNSPFISGIEILIVLAILEVIFKYRNTLDLTKTFSPGVRTLIVSCTCLFCSLFSLARPSTFLYFNF